MYQIALDLFSEDHLPRKPWCSDDLAYGLKVRPLSTAIKMRYIQHNRPGMTAFLAFDIDRADAGAAWIDSNAPAPNLIIKNPENGHAHYLYALEAPVCTTSNARLKPLQWLASIERTIAIELGADLGYAGLVMKNPLNGAWQTIPVETKAYSLERLAGGLDLLSAANSEKNREISGLGRNCEMFDLLRFWSYKAVASYWKPNGHDAWFSAVRERAHSYNTFSNPLDGKEVDQIAKSVGKWVWKHFSPSARRALIERTHTPELQSKRGKLKGAALRERGLDLLRSGLTVAQVVAETGAAERTVFRWLHRVDENRS